MINIAIVEDDDRDYDALYSNLNDFFHCDPTRFSVSRFTSGESFLIQYQCGYDLVFMDIQLSGENGMQTSEALRKLDPVVILIFVTNMQQFAIKGYEVGAFDFIVKPIKPAAFHLKLKRAAEVIESRQIMKCDITARHNGQLMRFSSEDLLYAEINGHYLNYHTTAGVYSTYGKMQEVEELLLPKGFLKCNRCYLVNPHFIQSVLKNEVVMINGDTLLISAARKKEFMRSLTVYIGKGDIM